MVQEARMARVDGGLRPESEGWFVLNAKDAVWWRSEGAGAACVFEGEGAAKFPQLGVNIHVLRPGEPNCLYHGESNQEDFLVLAGECLLLVEGQVRRLKSWDFVHCPPWTEHVFVGAGDGPCVILMVGARLPDEALRYPVSELAERYGASAQVETTDAREAYAGWAPAVRAPYREGDLPERAV